MARAVVQVGKPAAVQVEMQRSLPLVTRLEAADLAFNETLAAAVGATRSFYDEILREQEEAKKLRKSGVSARKEDMELRKALVDEAKTIFGNLTADSSRAAKDMGCLKNVYSNLQSLHNDIAMTDLRNTYTRQVKRLIYSSKERAILHHFVDSLSGEPSICRLLRSPLFG